VLALQKGRVILDAGSASFEAAARLRESYGGQGGQANVYHSRRSLTFKSDARFWQLDAGSLMLDGIAPG